LIAYAIAGHHAGLPDGRANNEACLTKRLHKIIPDFSYAPPEILNTVCTTDPEGPPRLHRVAKACQNYGQRVQYSVFECLLDPAQWAVLKQRLIDLIDQELDSMRFYYLGSNWRRRVEHVGVKKTLDQEGPMIV
jgi:CRISPR-associated protein Cas2